MKITGFLNRKGLQLIVLSLVMSFFVGCASIPEGQPRSKKDPWELVNRNVFSFNESLDKYVVKPITQVYEFIFRYTFGRGFLMFSQTLVMFTPQ